jgi:hypothetical protein
VWVSQGLDPATWGLVWSEEELSRDRYLRVLRRRFREAVNRFDKGLQTRDTLNQAYEEIANEPLPVGQDELADFAVWKVVKSDPVMTPFPLEDAPNWDSPTAALDLVRELAKLHP